MTDPLAPIPMTPDEIADLVSRARANGEAAAQAGFANLSSLRRGKPCMRHNPVLEEAARFALERKRTLSFAAREFDVHEDSLRKVWRRLYPDAPVLLSKRGAR